MGVSVYWPLSVLRVFVCVSLCLCVMSNQSTSKKPHHVSDLSKLDALFNKTHIKVLLVLRYRGSMCRSLISLSKIAHQMQRGPPFSKRIKTTEKAVRVGGLEATGKGLGGWTKFEKGEQVIQGGLHKTRGLGGLCQLYLNGIGDNLKSNQSEQQLNRERSW